MDTALFQWINGWPHFTWLDPLVVGFANIGVNEIFIPLFLSLFFGLLFKKHSWWQATLVLILAFVLVNYLVDITKLAFHRPRPVAVLESVHILGRSAGGYSFPSLAAANITVLFAYIFFVTKKYFWFWFGVIFILGLCRVYQGIHYPGDILGGWALGASVAWLAFLVFGFICEKLNLKARS